MLNCCMTNVSKRNSIWWRDIGSVSVSETSPTENWFKACMVYKLEIGNNIDFWHDIWLGAVPFYSQFPSLFLLSSLEHVKVADFGS